MSSYQTNWPCIGRAGEGRGGKTKGSWAYIRPNSPFRPAAGATVSGPAVRLLRLATPNDRFLDDGTTLDDALGGTPRVSHGPAIREIHRPLDDLRVARVARDLDVARISANHATRPVDLHRPERDVGVLRRAGQVEIDQHHFAGARVHEQIPHGAEDAAGDRPHFPRADVGLAVDDVPATHAAQWHQMLALPRVRADAGGVSRPRFDAFLGHESAPHDGLSWPRQEVP